MSNNDTHNDDSASAAHSAKIESARIAKRIHSECSMLSGMMERVDEDIEAIGVWHDLANPPDYAKLLSHFQNWGAATAHLIMISLSAFFCFLWELNISHIGAAIVGTSTLITGIFLLVTNNWKIKIDALCFDDPSATHKVLYGEPLLSRLMKEEEVGNRVKQRRGAEMYRFHFNSRRENFLNGLIAVEVLFASLGTFVWGFGDRVWPDPLSFPI